MTALLASVASRQEILIALGTGVDILDLKDPSRGALGAWPEREIIEAVGLVNGRLPVSATVGDLPLQGEILCQAVLTTAATGVDFVKVGFFTQSNAEEGPRDVETCLEALSRVTGKLAAMDCALVAVFFADQDMDFSWIGKAAGAGFKGVMLDTALKGSGSLRSHLDDGRLEEFVSLARECGLVTGLAGSLNIEDVLPLLAIGPDYLGFRGALCGKEDRTGSLDRAALEALCLQFDDRRGEIPVFAAAS